MTPTRELEIVAMVFGVDKKHIMPGKDGFIEILVDDMNNLEMSPDDFKILKKLGLTFNGIVKRDNRGHSIIKLKEKPIDDFPLDLD